MRASTLTRRSSVGCFGSSTSACSSGPGLVGRLSLESSKSWELIPRLRSPPPFQPVSVLYQADRLGQLQDSVCVWHEGRRAFGPRLLSGLVAEASPSLRSSASTATSVRSPPSSSRRIFSRLPYSLLLAAVNYMDTFFRIGYAIVRLALPNTARSSRLC